MMSLTKNQQPPTKKICSSLPTARLAKSFEPLNSSLPLSVPELRLRKAICDPVVSAQNAQNIQDAKELPKGL